jgi:chromosomal replication initiator protein
LWTSCLGTLRRLVPEAIWSSCFQQTSALALDTTALLVAVPSSLVRDRIESRWRPQVEEALAVANATGISVQFEVRTDGPETLAPHGDAVDAGDPGGSAVTSEPEAGPQHPEQLTLNPRYTFDDFVTGTSNSFAHAAALAVAETPARSFNPLFIYSGVGLGKTHLLHAISHYVHQNYPAYRVRYVSCEAFLNDFVNSIRTNTTAEFKRHYRENDILLVDDVHFLEGKEGLQEEFFHTFNDLHGANKQIVLSSDRPPSAIPTLSHRLRSRFEGGLTTDIQPPDLETRLAILRKKAEGEPATIPDDVLEFIATNIRNNIRELQGALIRVSAYASLNRTPLSVKLAASVLSDSLSDSRPRVITPSIILEATSKMYDFTVEELCGRSRRRPLVIARQVGMYVCRTETDLSYPAIARAYGGRDHTTVIHAVDKIEALMGERRQIYQQVEELRQTIREAPR